MVVMDVSLLTMRPFSLVIKNMSLRQEFTMRRVEVS